MKVSVVVVTYRRLERLDKILKAWLKETPDTWLCDCSKEGFKTELPINIIRAIPDPGNKIRHAVALLTGGDIVIKADDDIIPHEGLANDFQNYMEQIGPAILSVHGRTFHGEKYYSNTKMYGSKGIRNDDYEKNVIEPIPVDFVGVITCAPRELLPMDLIGCENEIEDLFWQMEKYPNAKKYVIPTDKYMNLPESKDKGRLCAPNTESRIIRQAHYQEWYKRNYENRSSDE
jgi:hypothetical protein